MGEPSLIGVDWGTSRLRLALVDGAGAVLAEHAADAGILGLSADRFAAVLADAIGALGPPPGLPIVLSGMITSRQGWHELPYLGCPAGADDLARALTRVVEPDLGALHFITGLAWTDPDGSADVMRGEETQILGQDDLAGGEAVVLPGTHSKWVVLEAGRIARFRTYMTGELFAVLEAHSILGRLITPGSEDAAGFARGVRSGLDGAGLLGSLFSARAMPLLGQLPEAAVGDYLSGLLIGAEIAEARASHRPEVVVLIGSDALARRYATALDIAGIRHRPGHGDAAYRGQWRVARARGLIK